MVKSVHAVIVIKLGIWRIRVETNVVLTVTKLAIWPPIVLNLLCVTCVNLLITELIPVPFPGRVRFQRLHLTNLRLTKND